MSLFNIILGYLTGLGLKGLIHEETSIEGEIFLGFKGGDRGKILFEGNVSIDVEVLCAFDPLGMLIP